MRIGSDYDKIQWDAFGLELLEPNALLGDVVIFLLAIYLAFKVRRKNSLSQFSDNWIRFYVVFGLGFLFGGLGHLFFNYTGLLGKIPAWITGIIAVFFAEQAMFSIYPKEKTKKILLKISKIKLIAFLLLEILIFFNADVEENPGAGLIVPMINSVIGMGFALGYLGYIYEKQIHPSFRFLWISALILVPSAIAQAFKINLHPWMDRNDISHVLLFVSIILYYMCLKRYLTSSSAPTFERQEESFENQTV